MKKVMFVIVLALLFASCRTSGYGCKGTATWNDVLRKANRPF